MELQLVPLNTETGEVITLDPTLVTQMDNTELTSFLSNLKLLEKLKKVTEKEIKQRLDEGQLFKRLSYGKQQFTRLLVMDNEAKAELVNKYGFESVEPLSVLQLQKKYGDSIYQDIEPYIVEKPKAQAIKWDN
ncbi:MULTISPECIES: hypothetical protein [unclassified Lactococcus]|uniref:hypothetical protein n=1 Tax=unclassified Lactococcus TaxID=2643510 RepID=UPI0011C9A578|nr:MULTISPECIES: hypothetical protein [unclassified Lactococcus]MQW24108.1 hypothetical protein [Lactococcus sp. dk101]TXK33902.1 hypothetical protein FVP42_11435 [Lactococcus sp. dk310]TXK45327.1 hypothetical protein FVP43_11505 [Lactococcus sp. dk322]